MAIQATCDKCNASFQLRNEFAGKRIKCPKCTHTFMVSAGTAKPQNVNAGAVPASAGAAGAVPGAANRGQPAAYNPLLDLLEDAGVQAKARGQGCPVCGAEVSPNAMLCIDCGFNFQTGQQLHTAVLIDRRDSNEGSELTDAQKRMAKAEKEIESMPVSSFGQDFGEGNESYFVALAAGIAMLVIAFIGVLIVLTMDKITEFIQPAAISIIASIFICTGCIIWITAVAFMTKPVHGIVCLITGLILGPVYLVFAVFLELSIVHQIIAALSAVLYCCGLGFMQGGKLLLPAIILAVSVLIGIVSLVYLTFAGQPDYSGIESLPQVIELARVMLTDRALAKT